MLGDQIGIGPWLFVVTPANAARETLLPARLSNALAAPRLELLIDFSKSINRAETSHLIESSIVTAAVRGSGFQRAALIYSSNNSPRMLHGYPQSLALEDISSAVLEASRRLRCVEMRDLSNHERSDSLVAMDVRNALAVSEAIDDRGDLTLYLDVRRQEQDEQPDASRFCQSLLQLGGLAIRRLDHQQQLQQQRESIYADLHDDLGARLLNLIYRASCTDDAEDARAMLQDLRDVVSRPSGQSQRLVDLLAGIRSEASTRLQTNETRLSWLQHDDDLLDSIDWSARNCANLSRWVREAVNNALKHAQPQSIQFGIECDSESLNLTITHDGIISEPESWEIGRGIQTMKKRARDLDAKLTWHARDDLLVTSLTVPLDAQQASAWQVNAS